MQPAVSAGRLSFEEKSTNMTCLTCLVVMVLALLAGSPLLLAQRAQRRRQRDFDKMRRIRFHPR
jgi:hypothetical protein